jgi:hypothetical protein
MFCSVNDTAAVYMTSLSFILKGEPCKILHRQKNPHAISLFLAKKLEVD